MDYDNRWCGCGSAVHSLLSFDRPRFSLHPLVSALEE